MIKSILKNVKHKEETGPKKLDPNSEWNRMREERAKPWFDADGDKTLRLDYKLNQKSVIFDLGGYEGQWASDIFAKYLSTIYVFEPFHKYFIFIKNRFKHNKNIHPFEYGLSKKKGKVKLFTNGDSTSEFLETDKGEYVTMRLESFVDFCNRHKIKKIDLVKINIEGGEYDLLEGILERDFQKNIKNFQIQFHDYTEDSEQRMVRIQKELSKTHHLTYQFKFVWENWELNK